jgi:hypothetical protein
MQEKQYIIRASWRYQFWERPMGTKIIFGGKEYSSIEEMPPEVRDEYERAISQLRDIDRNGIPDVVQDTGKPIIRIEQHRYMVNGREYSSLDDLPPAIRRTIEKATPHSIKQCFEIGIKPIATHDADSPGWRPKSFASSPPDAAEEIRTLSLRDLLMIGIGVIIGLVIAAVAVLFLISNNMI